MSARGPAGEHPYAKLARIAWQAAAAGDVDALSDACAPDLVWHASGRGPRSGVYRGQEAVFAYLASIGDAADRFDSDLEDVLVGTDRVAVLFRIRGRRGRRTLDSHFVLLFRIEADRIAEVWAIPRDQYAIDEFWSGDGP
jgi:ketosteroid isomerase-like protein